MSTREWCRGTTWGGRMGLVRCGNYATRDGYCGVHHPDAQAKRRAATLARQQARLKVGMNRAAQRARDREDAARWRFFLSTAAARLGLDGQTIASRVSRWMKERGPDT